MKKFLSMVMVLALVITMLSGISVSADIVTLTANYPGSSGLFDSKTDEGFVFKTNAGSDTSGNPYTLNYSSKWVGAYANGATNGLNVMLMPDIFNIHCTADAHTHPYYTITAPEGAVITGYSISVAGPGGTDTVTCAYSGEVWNASSGWRPPVPNLYVYDEASGTYSAEPVKTNVTYERAPNLATDHPAYYNEKGIEDDTSTYATWTNLNTTSIKLTLPKSNTGGWNGVASKLNGYGLQSITYEIDESMIVKEDIKISNLNVSYDKENFIGTADVTNNTEGTVSPVMVLASYDSYGHLEDVAIGTSAVSAATGTLSATLAMNNSAYAKGFVFNNMSDLKPLINASSEKWRKAVAFTFDDGPSDYQTPITDYLLSEGVTGTYFVVGQHMENPERAPYAKYSYDNGMEIGNHGYTAGHSDWNISWSYVLTEEEQAAKTAERIKTQQIIKDVIGEEAKIFRAPNGKDQDSVLDAYDMVCIQFYALEGTSSDPDELLAYMKEQVAANNVDGKVYLIHENRDYTLACLQKLIPYLKSEGYAIYSVSELGQRIEGGLYKKNSNGNWMRWKDIPVSR